MLKFTVEGETIADVRKALLAAAGALAGAADSTKETAAEKPKPAAAKDKPKPAEEDEPAGLDYEKDVRPVIVKLVKDHGREHAAEVLSAFETDDGETVTKGQELQPRDWAAAVAAVKKLQKKLDKEKAEADD